VVTLVWFALQAAWFALTAIYPQAFDEQYHFGLIKLHAQQWSPFFATQPAGADQFGAVVRDPSLLYHYLLSFPYRILSWLTDSQTIQLIALRFISVGLLVWAFILFRRLLLLMGLGRAKTHALILFFSLLPTFPVLGGQLGYDNLLIPVSTLTLLWAVRLRESYHTQRLDWLLVVRLVIAMVLFSTIKYAYLPIFAGVVLYFVPIVWHERRVVVKQLTESLRKLSRTQQAAYLLAAVISVWLFAGSIGLNLVRYHGPNPECQKVLTVARCSEFGPFARDYQSKQDATRASFGQMVAYPYNWTKNMMRESFFSVYSFLGPDGKPYYYGGDFVPQLLFVGWVWFWISLVSLIAGATWLWRQPKLRLVLVVSGFYVLSLLVFNLREYYQTAYIAAVHGRYLFPVAIPLFGCALLSLWHLSERLPRSLKLHRQSIAALALLVTAVIFTQGGGLGTYILLSQDVSFWPFSPLAQHANQVIRDTLRAVILGE
jgi:hypothetical protein